MKDPAWINTLGDRERKENLLKTKLIIPSIILAVVTLWILIVTNYYTMNKEDYSFGIDATDVLLILLFYATYYFLIKSKLLESVSNSRLLSFYLYQAATHLEQNNEKLFMKYAKRAVDQIENSMNIIESYVGMLILGDKIRTLDKLQIIVHKLNNIERSKKSLTEYSDKIKRISISIYNSDSLSDEASNLITQMSGQMDKIPGSEFKIDRFSSFRELPYKIISGGLIESSTLLIIFSIVSIVYLMFFNTIKLASVNFYQLLIESAFTLSGFGIASAALLMSDKNKNPKLFKSIILSTAIFLLGGAIMVFNPIVVLDSISSISEVSVILGSVGILLFATSLLNLILSIIKLITWS